MVGTTGDTAATAPVDTTAVDKGAESSAPAAEAPGAGLGAHGKKVSTQDIQLVQNLIERCLQMYMSQREVRSRLSIRSTVSSETMVARNTGSPDGMHYCFLHEPTRHKREVCMQVVYTLQQQAKVEPGFTQLVWQKLEEQNPDFFKAYYTRLKLKDQIVLFNHLLEQQVAMFQKMQRQWMAPTGRLCDHAFLPKSERLRPSGKGYQGAARLSLPSHHG